MGARLGQHFLKAEWVARTLAESVPTTQGETIVEVGPGTGALTRILLETKAPVIAIEKDEKLAEQLTDTFGEALREGQFRLITGDVRDFSPEKENITAYVVAANIPYYITGEIIRMFLTCPHQPRALSLLIQKEVAQRIVARDAARPVDRRNRHRRIVFALRINVGFDFFLLAHPHWDNARRPAFRLCRFCS